MLILLSSANSKTVVDVVNGVPDLQRFSEPTLSILQTAFDAGNYIVLPEPLPSNLTADWQSLQNIILGGSLYEIYSRLTAASFASFDATLAEIINANNIAVAAGKLDQAVAVTKVEAAVADSFQLLVTTSSYTFTNEEKNLWNEVTDSLNFSNLVHLP